MLSALLDGERDFMPYFYPSPPIAGKLAGRAAIACKVLPVTCNCSSRELIAALLTPAAQRTKRIVDLKGDNIKSM